MERNSDNIVEKMAYKVTKRTTAIFSIVLVLCLALIGGGYCGYKFIRHEQNQKTQIQGLSSRVAVLEEENKASNADIVWGDGFNYLAIGNSITRCPGDGKDWWWEIGMAASTEEKDYFHLVSSYLSTVQSETVVSYAFNAAAWELQANNRAEVLTLGLWDTYLSDKIDLVTIQLSENVSDNSTFESDFQYMVKYVAEKCPNAQIIVIDDFWDDEKSEMKKNAVDSVKAEGLNVGWVDLSEIRNKSEYQAGIGAIVYDKDGKEHSIKHDGVAMHPNDSAMGYYAKNIEKLIK